MEESRETAEETIRRYQEGLICLTQMVRGLIQTDEYQKYQNCGSDCRACGTDDEEMVLSNSMGY